VNRPAQTPVVSVHRWALFFSFRSNFPLPCPITWEDGLPFLENASFELSQEELLESCPENFFFLALRSICAPLLPLALFAGVFYTNSDTPPEIHVTQTHYPQRLLELLVFPYPTNTPNSPGQALKVPFFSQTCGQASIVW